MTHLQAIELLAPMKFILWTEMAIILMTASIGYAAPIPGPDVSTCLPPASPVPEDIEDCCISKPVRPIKDFQFPTDLPMRVRRPVHRLDEESILKFERAVSLMRALPDDDPRSWYRQSKLHCAYAGSTHYQQQPAGNHEIRPGNRERLSVHFNWFFLAFHRWFIYFQERILASLIDDDTFAIPFWAWDIQSENSSGSPVNVIPPIFVNETLSLYDPRRCRAHAPPQRVHLEVDAGCPHVMDPDYIRRSNYYNLWRVMKGETRTTEAFHGGKFSFGDPINGAKAGVFELGPHAAVHSWVGDERRPHHEDMGALYRSATDPLFSVHHAQVDRLWTIWKSFGGRDYVDPDYLQSQLLFYDENGDLVRVSIAQALVIEKLQVSYEEVALDWAGEGSDPPTSIRVRGDPKYLPKEKRRDRSEWNGNILSSILPEFKKWLLGAGTNEKVILGAGRSIRTVHFFRPMDLTLSVRKTALTLLANCGMASISGSSSAANFDEVLVIKGVVEDRPHGRISFNIFLELPEADETTPRDCLESLGQISFEASGRKREEDAAAHQNFTYKIGMGERFAALGISRRTSPLSFTFVPAWDPNYDADVKIELTELTLELQPI